MGRLSRNLSALLAALILTACGGGSGSSTTDSTGASGSVVVQSGTATDGLARFNYWRSQIGLSQLSRNAHLDKAAEGHSNYQALNNVITHKQTPGNPGFTGICLTDDPNTPPSDPDCAASNVSRLEQAQYPLPADNYAVGEVISQAPSSSGVSAADALVTAIYHRFVIFEPMFKEAGAGAVTSASGNTYFTVDFAAIGLDQGIGFGNLVEFPKDGQNQPVPTSFSSDSELPDPVPSADVVGYPISVHADLIYELSVNSFTVTPRGGSALQTQNLWPGIDPNTEQSEAAIVPLSPLQPSTVYDVAFSGTMTERGSNNVVQRSKSINLSWSFTTQP